MNDLAMRLQLRYVAEGMTLLFDDGCAEVPAIAPYPGRFAGTHRLVTRSLPGLRAAGYGDAPRRLARRSRHQVTNDPLGVRNVRDHDLRRQLRCSVPR